LEGTVVRCNVAVAVRRVHSATLENGDTTLAFNARIVNLAGVKRWTLKGRVLAWVLAGGH